MKALSRFFVLVIGIAAFTAKAQEADSVTVIYDNQKTQIPVPEFGKKTTIKMADSIQTIEIAVSRSRPSDSLSAVNELAIKNPKKKTKWFSQVEAGYVLGFVAKDRFPFYISSPPYVYHINNDLLPGFRLGLSVFDRERIINSNLSYNVGFKFGIVDHFRTQKSKPEIIYDTINQIQNIYIDYDPYTITHLQLLIPFGMRYSFLSGKSISKISFGTNLGTAFNIVTFRGDDGNLRNSKSLSPLVLQPFLGFEYGKIGLLSTLDIEMINGNIAEIKYSLGFSLTYRFF